MPSVELFRGFVQGPAQTGAVTITQDCEAIAVTVMRHDAGNAELRTTFLIDGAMASGGSSPSTFVETLNGPFVAGVELAAGLESDEPVEVSLIASW